MYVNMNYAIFVVLEVNKDADFEKKENIRV